MDDCPIFENVKKPMALLKRELNVDVGRKDGLITVSLSYKDHDEAAKVVDNVVESYKAFKSKQRRDMASGVLNLLEKDKDKTDTQLAAKLDEVLKFKQENNTFSFADDKNNYVIQRAKSLSSELDKAQDRHHQS